MGESIEVIELLEELEKIKIFMNKLNEDDDDIVEDVVGDAKEMENKNSSKNNVNENEGKFKKWYNKIMNLKIKREKEKYNAKKGYQKFSKWLKDHSDHQLMTVLFIILAGVDITHLDLLGSKIHIRIPSLNLLGSMRFRSFNIYFNAKLSRTSFYVNQVVSLGYTPVYNILKASIDLFNKGLDIIKQLFTLDKKSKTSNLVILRKEKEDVKTKTFNTI
ncbi:hypothetical protein RclHR1_02350011 [Rhizophagus clarus]|uniref:Uncharacterized protein n=1 Tax=Rhizophagus clarus TaxID=94130 RepID=A0A2Z6R0T2_9GLOM|nr:hypothetical protein RclHR1_02350011 [Rhizophagus clarus]GES76013.1 hypothetical protein GLOIN_2v1469500 [Rhizophagus clarus]